MATARLTIGTVLGTVVSAAETVTSTLNAVSKTVGMANAYVEKAAREQQGRYLNDAAQFAVQLTNEGTMAEAEMNLEVIKFCAKSAQHAKLFEGSYEKYAKLHGLIPKTEDEATIMKPHAAERVGTRSKV